MPNLNRSTKDLPIFTSPDANARAHWVLRAASHRRGFGTSDSGPFAASAGGTSPLRPTFARPTCPPRRELIAVLDTLLLATWSTLTFWTAWSLGRGWVFFFPSPLAASHG